MEHVPITLELVILVIVISVADINTTFPQATPTESCDSLSINRVPGLGIQSVDIPYVLLQTAVSYKPGQVINVSIERRTQSTFQGFIVQALDKMSGKYIGRFLDADGLTVMDECSAVTQGNSEPKTAVHLAWVAPLNQRGDVIFRGIVIEAKNKHYEGLISRLENPRAQRSKYARRLSIFF